MNCVALVLVFLCLVYTHLCKRVKSKKILGERLTPPRAQVGKRFFQAFAQRNLHPSELNGADLSKLAQGAVKTEAAIKARVAAGAAAGVAAGMVAGGVIASLDWDNTVAMQNLKDIEWALHGALALSQKSSPPSGVETSHQTFPLVTIDSRDSRQLLQNWADSSTAYIDKGLNPGQGKTSQLSFEIYDNAKACLRLHDVVAVVDRSLDQLPLDAPALEMVGMIPKTSLQSGSSAVALESLGALDASVQALGLFSRETVEDDRGGSLRREIEEHYGKQFTQGRWGLGSPKKKFDVFAIESLADAPDSRSWDSESSARVLMSKIAQYAEQEQKVVVVLERAYDTSTLPSTGFLQYYERLGFKRVEMEKEFGPHARFKKVVRGQKLGKHVLLYVGDAHNKMAGERDKKMAQDKSVEDQQMMVGMDLWTGL